ncbi:helix-turn-helix domain-containing protein [Rhodococcus sp. NPDC127530]|uniref:AraC-like ligand-binding domain-containing protein n=1 Tax=unclassified Rhodococcus (in: high G+C Gram-positive bacteria) TaxID=192944 RepID=UPI0036297050
MHTAEGGRTPTTSQQNSPAVVAEAAPATRGDQLDAWKEAVNDTFLPLKVQAARQSEFTWQLKTGYVGPLQLTHAEADAELVGRTPKLAASDDNDHYAIALQGRGSCRFRQDGREVEVRPGEFTIYDCTRPFDIEWSIRHRTVVAMFDRTTLDVKADDVARVTSTPISGRDGMGALVRSMLIQLSRNPEAYNGAAANRVANCFLDLVAAFYSCRLAAEPTRSAAAQKTLLFRVKAFIEDQLCDPELSVEVVAAAHFISVRYLYKLFQNEQMTIAQWIRHRRLEHSRRDLADPLQALRPVGEIAARNGMLNAPHFSQIFRAEYGASPSEYRRRVLRPS